MNDNDDTLQGETVIGYYIDELVQEGDQDEQWFRHFKNRLAIANFMPMRYTTMHNALDITYHTRLTPTQIYEALDETTIPHIHTKKVFRDTR